jgi:hypothetical protein
LNAAGWQSWKVDIRSLTPPDANRGDQESQGAEASGHPFNGPIKDCPLSVVKDAQ